MAPDPGAQSERVLDVRDLRRSYGRFTRVEAVRGVTFNARRGQIYGLIGPDGAGKTTVIQMLAAVLRPHGGTALVAGLDVVAAGEAVKQRIGYMPQGLGSNLYDSLTVRENIEFFRELRKLPEDIYQANRAELLAMTRLTPFLERRAVNLSGGMRQKLALICTLIHLPDVLLLDEPTTGVDPISRQEFWQIIGRLVEQRGATVLVSTSYLDEAERCHRIALMHAGTIVAEGTPDDVRRPGKRSVTEGAVTEGAVTEGAAKEGAVTSEATLEDVFLDLLGGGERGTRVAFPSAVTPATGDPIECRGVTRQFGAFTAVDRVDLTVRRGEIFGLLGPNGAGKTTLIKMMCGLLEPSAGRIAIAGIDVRTRRERVWTAIGYMSQRFSLYQDLTINQNLQLYADLYGLPRSAYEELMVRLGLEPFASRLTSDLPIGVRQRASLLCAVLHRPPIVFLDEPTSGVDPRARRLFWELIASLSRDAGITVLVSTHYMDEATHCDRLGLMDRGRLIADGSPADVKDRSERQSGRLLVVHAVDTRAAHQAVLRIRPSALLIGDDIRVRTFDADADRGLITAALEREGLAGVRVQSVPISMDEAFIDFVQRAEALHA
jgi:ABC-2 type transport system ATP-binding protein